MNKAVIISLVLFCCGLQMQAQTLTEAEVTVKMNEAFELNRAEKTAEALDAFLLVGRNTEQQRTDVERQVYVCSQTMACMCYETLKRYEEAYLLAKKLINGRLAENEKKDVAYLYAMNGYMYATGFMLGANKQLAKARAILEEIMPYADGKVREYALPKIPLTWYFEATQHHLAKNYDRALA